MDFEVKNNNKFILIFFSNNTDFFSFNPKQKVDFKNIYIIFSLCLGKKIMAFIGFCSKVHKIIKNCI